MWDSYRKKWGPEAVEDAFEKVRNEKKKFYRAKMTALFEACQPGKLAEVDNLMTKHEGSYEHMFKRWMETNKFDAQAVVSAHAKAMQAMNT